MTIKIRTASCERSPRCVETNLLRVLKRYVKRAFTSSCVTTFRNAEVQWTTLWRTSWEAVGLTRSSMRSRYISRAISRAVGLRLEDRIAAAQSSLMAQKIPRWLSFARRSACGGSPASTSHTQTVSLVTRRASIRSATRKARTAVSTSVARASPFHSCIRCERYVFASSCNSSIAHSQEERSFSSLSESIPVSSTTCCRMERHVFSVSAFPRLTRWWGSTWTL